MRFTFDVPDSFDYMVLGKTKVTTDVRKINAESAARVFTQGLLLAVRNASANAVVNTADGLDQKDRYKAMSKAEQSAWADLHAVDVLLTAVTMTQKKVDAIERNDWAAQTSDGGDAVALRNMIADLFANDAGMAAAKRGGTDDRRDAALALFAKQTPDLQETYRVSARNTLENRRIVAKETAEKERLAAENRVKMGLKIAL